MSRERLAELLVFAKGLSYDWLALRIAAATQRGSRYESRIFA